MQKPRRRRENHEGAHVKGGDKHRVVRGMGGGKDAVPGGTPEKEEHNKEKSSSPKRGVHSEKPPRKEGGGGGLVSRKPVGSLDFEKGTSSGQHCKKKERYRNAKSENTPGEEKKR